MRHPEMLEMRLEAFWCPPNIFGALALRQSMRENRIRRAYHMGMGPKEGFGVGRAYPPSVYRFGLLGEYKPADIY